MRDPADLRYTSSGEWVQLKRDRLVVGLSEDAVASLGEVTHVELPDPDDQHRYDADDELCVISALRSARSGHAPVAGRVTAINHDLFAHPELIVNDPYGNGWLYEMKPDRIQEALDLMDIDEYEASLPDFEEEE